MAVWQSKSDGRRYWIVYDSTGDNTFEVQINRAADAKRLADMMNGFENNYDKLLKRNQELTDQIKQLEKLKAESDAATDVQMC